MHSAALVRSLHRCLFSRACRADSTVSVHRLLGSTISAVVCASSVPLACFLSKNAVHKRGRSRPLPRNGAAAIITRHPEQMQNAYRLGCDAQPVRWVRAVSLFFVIKMRTPHLVPCGVRNDATVVAAATERSVRSNAKKRLAYCIVAAGGGRGGGAQEKS